jgi:alpha-1,6-mannosyltransferase
MSAYRSVRSFIAELRPDVLEAHDPFFSVPFALWMRRRGWHRGILTSFCHAEPVGTYATPHAPRVALDWANRALSHLQRQFDMTFVASESMRTRLTRAGVDNVVKMGFGLDPELLTMRRRRMSGRRTRLLYAGRLDADKEFGLVLDAIPHILRHTGVRLTIAGTGRYHARAKALRHPRFRYLGFLGDRPTMRAVYAAHDVLLAPGRFETFGLAALEAAAAGLIAVARHVAVYESMMGERVAAEALDRPA